MVLSYPLAHALKARLSGAGIENDVGKDRHNLPEAVGAMQKLFSESFHLRPKSNTSHGKLTLEALAKIVIQTSVLRVIELKSFRHLQRVSGGLTSGEEGTERLQPHLMSDGADATLQAQPAGNGFGEELTVEEEKGLRVNLIQEGRKFMRNVTGRKDVLAVEKPGWLIIRQVVPAQHPTQGRQDQLTKRHGRRRRYRSALTNPNGRLDLKFVQLVQRFALNIICKRWIGFV